MYFNGRKEILRMLQPNIYTEYIYIYRYDNIDTIYS